MRLLARTLAQSINLCQSVKIHREKLAFSWMWTSAAKIRARPNQNVAKEFALRASAAKTHTAGQISPHRPSHSNYVHSLSTRDFPILTTGYALFQRRSGGDDGDRTRDPLNAIQVLSQLSYIPISRSIRCIAFSTGCVPVRLRPVPARAWRLEAGSITAIPPSRKHCPRPRSTTSGAFRRRCVEMAPVPRIGSRFGGRRHLRARTCVCRPISRDSLDRTPNWCRGRSGW